MKIAEIESKIATLKARHAELDAKSYRAGVWDGDVLSAMSAVDIELRRLSQLREKALVSDLIEETPAQPAAAPARPAALPFPRDFKRDPGDEADPTEDLEAVPDEAEAFGKFHEQLFNFTLRRAVDYTARVRGVKGGDRAVAYTQGQHWAFLGALALIQTELKTLVALGRDRRNEVEKRLLTRIEALEARPSLKYAGVWNEKSVFGEGNLVTDGGSMWHANRASVGTRPGTDDSWQLVVKKGRDGKGVKQ